jgi:hypothetical protein
MLVLAKGTLGPAAFAQDPGTQKSSPPKTWQEQEPKKEDVLRDRAALRFQLFYNSLGCDILFYGYGKDTKTMKVEINHSELPNMTPGIVATFNEKKEWIRSLRDVGFEHVLIMYGSKRAYYKVTEKGLELARK